MSGLPSCPSQASLGPSSKANQPSRDHQSPWLLTLLLLLAILPYVNTLQNGFVYDDNNEVLSNPYIRNFDHVGGIFSTRVLAHLGARGATNYYHPISIFGFLICYKLFGLLPYGLHLANLLLHALIVCLLFGLALVLRGERDAPVTAGGTPALHGKAADLKSRSALHPLVIMLLLCGAVGSLRAQTPAPDNANSYVQQFESSYHEVRSLSADFTQTYTLGGGLPRIESGRVTFARGGLMRWDYQVPTKKLFLSDGKEMSLYVPEEHQLTRAPMKSSQDFRAPFELLLSRFNLRKVFARVEMADKELEHDPAHHVLRAFPKKEFAQEYDDVLIELDPQFNMRRLVVNYADHSRMDFRFDHIERNPALPHSLFEFTPPAGTEVIDQHQGK